jgi:catalase
MVREVLDGAARERLVSNVVGHRLNGVSEPILQRAFEYWRNVDEDAQPQDQRRRDRRWDVMHGHVPE